MYPFFFLIAADIVGRPRSSPGATVILLAIVCIMALMLPTQGEKHSHIPEYLHLTVNQKLIAAYVLGKDILSTSLYF